MSFLLAAMIAAFVGQAAPAPNMTPIDQTIVAQVCSGCGCKGGPGWRSKRTGQCVGKKNLTKECGSPPSSKRCVKEN